MDSPNEQPPRRPTRQRASTATRGRLLEAAGELIAEVGWGRVTTRSVAERAGLPHGAVSYHFSGKQELLSEAAVLVFERTFPLAELESLGSLRDALALMEQWMAASQAEPSSVVEVGVEALMESARDRDLADRIGAMLDAYRACLVRLAEADVAAGADFAGASPVAVATLIAAAADGLVLHARMDRRLDSAAAMAALRALLLR